MGETRVDLLHLLEDLLDAYPGGLEETILTEIVANSLDSGATRISLVADPAGPTLTALDDGSGLLPEVWRDRLQTRSRWVPPTIRVEAELHEALRSSSLDPRRRAARMPPIRQ